MSYFIVRKIGYQRRSGVNLFTVAVVMKGALLRRVLEEPWNTPVGATAIPEGFSIKEHTHVWDLPSVLPGHLATVVDPWSLADGDKLAVSVAGGAAQTATIAGQDAANYGAVTVAEMVAVLERDLADVRVEYHPHLGSNHLMLMAANPEQSIQIVGGELQAKLGFSGTLAIGSMDAGEQAVYHAADFDEIDYLVDILDPNQTHTDLAPTLRSWDAVLFP